jgi:hypothetical protein
LNNERIRPQPGVAACLRAGDLGTQSVLFDPKSLPANGAAHRKVVIVDVGCNDQRPKIDANEVGKMHTPTSVATGHHRCGRVKGHGSC